MLKKSNLINFVFFSAIVFFLSVIVGFVVAESHPELAQKNIQYLYEKFDMLSDEKSSIVFLYIFLNNSLIGFGAVISFFLLGFGPLFVLASNGFVIGLTLNVFSQKQGFLDLAAALLPHGIVEIPSFLIATGTGLWLAVQFARKIHARQPFKNSFIRSMKIFFAVVLPLNLIAAFIEVYVTPIIYSLL